MVGCLPSGKDQNQTGLGNLACAGKVVVCFFWPNLDLRTNRFQEEGNDVSTGSIKLS